MLIQALNLQHSCLTLKTMLLPGYSTIEMMTAEAENACLQVRRCLVRMQHTVISKALATWQQFIERRTIKQHALMLHAASIRKQSLLSFQVSTASSPCVLA